MAKKSTGKPADRKIDRSVLLNGVTVWTERVPRSQGAAVGLWIRGGSRYEDLKEAGATHMLQRIALWGTEKRSAVQVGNAIEKLGGDVEYHTARDHAGWLSRSKDWKGALDLIADLTLHPAITKEAIDAESAALLEELSADEKNPDFDLDRMYLRSLWKGHGLCRAPRGRLLEIKGNLRLEDFKPKSLVRFQRESVHPTGLTVIAAGDVDHDEVVAEAEKLFGEMEEPKKTVSTTTPTPFKVFAMRRRAGLEGVRMQVGVPAFGADDERRYVASIFNALVGAGPESRLMRMLASGELPATEVRSSLDLYEDVGSFSVRLYMEREHAAAVLTEVVGMLRKSAQVPVDDDELAAAKAYVHGEFAARLENVKTRVADLLRQELYFGRVLDPVAEAELVDRTTAEQVRMLASEWVAPHTLSVAMLGDLKGVVVSPSILRW